MIIENIKKLSEICAVSGNEKKASQEVFKMFEKYCDNVYTDALGSVIGVKKGLNSNSKVMIEAHIDEIGMMVTKITDEGFIKFTNIGGIDTRILPGNEVIVHSKEELFGVVGAIAPHLLSVDDLNKPVPKDKLFIDVGLDADEAKEKVSVGDLITFKSETTVLNKKYIAAKSQDDRASICAILEVLENLKDKKLPFDLYVVGAVQEEVGLRGSATVTYAIDPDIAIAIDVCHGDTPDASDSTFKLGSGCVLEVGPNISKKLSNHIIKVMDENKIKYSVEACGGNTGTDAWAMQIAKNGVPTALFSIPLRYMHTQYEVSSVEDINSTSNAICAFLTSFESVGDIFC
ncbi:MAG: M42 family metallopeptidase [Ruminococcaceae bacterium]|nr:M42 family metallopeptidase [Oscillospiraceae bacterium]